MTFFDMKMIITKKLGFWSHALVLLHDATSKIVRNVKIFVIVLLHREQVTSCDKFEHE